MLNPKHPGVPINLSPFIPYHPPQTLYNIYPIQFLLNNCPKKILLQITTYYLLPSIHSLSLTQPQHPTSYKHPSTKTTSYLPQTTHFASVQKTMNLLNEFLSLIIIHESSILVWSDEGQMRQSTAKQIRWKQWITVLDMMHSGRRFSARVGSRGNVSIGKAVKAVSTNQTADCLLAHLSE